MKQTELRIGNYITVHGCLQEIVELPLPENCTEENTKPIPLTEEWLLRFGFANKYSENHFWRGEVCIWKAPSGFLENKYRHEIKHVHQLQNLHFCLTGNELSVNK